MFNVLLILHLVAVCCWLGGAMYERIYIVGGIRRTKGTEMEAHLIKMMLGTVPFFLTSVLVILVTGIIMSAMNDYGFFEWTWLGLKRYILIAILLTFFIYIGPRMGRIGKQLKVSMEKKKGVDDESRALIAHITHIFDLIHLGVLFNIILAVTKFF